MVNNMFGFIIDRYVKNIAGMAAVEFALIAPILALTLIVTIDMGMFITSKMQVHNAANVIAEYVASQDDDVDVQIVAEESYAGVFADITATSDFSCECDDSVIQACPVTCIGEDHQRRFVDVTVGGSFSPIFAYPGFESSIQIEGVARTRVD